MAFPVEEGLKQTEVAADNADMGVFMAFPVEEGLKRQKQEVNIYIITSFYGLSSRRRIETNFFAGSLKTLYLFLWPFQ